MSENPRILDVDSGATDGDLEELVKDHIDFKNMARSAKTYFLRRPTQASHHT